MRRVPDAGLSHPAGAVFLGPLALALALALAGPAWGQCQVAKLRAPSGDKPFITNGTPVAMSGDLAILGAYSDNVNGFVSGSAYIYRFDGWAWTEQAKLLPSDGDEQHQFGISVAISDNVAVVGAYRADGVTGGGAAYVFRYDPQASEWIEEVKLVASDGVPTGQFGISVAISGNVAIAGADGDDDNGHSAGAVYVFRYDPDTSKWVQESKLLASDGMEDDRFGASVALHGDLAIIGAPYARYPCYPPIMCQTGAAYVYRFDPEVSQWVQEAKLLDSDGWQGDRFGGSVATDGTLVLAGAMGNDDAGSNSGSAQVFRFDQATATWVDEGKLLASDGAAGDWFGVSVAIRGDVAIVGTSHDQDLGYQSGSAYVYRFDPDIKGWAKETKLLAVDGDSYDEFGSFVSISANRAIVGASDFDEHSGEKIGSAYVFDLLNLAGPDCNINGICDAVDLRDKTSADCNTNDVPDECDITVGWSQDCNSNGLPDDCESDCNDNGVQDDCDIAQGTSEDCNENGIPDECEFDYFIDDGSAESAVGGGPADRIWLNHFAVAPGEETIVSIGIAWVSEYMPQGVPTTLLVYGDPNNDGDPSDAVLLATAPTESASTEPDEFVVVPIQATFLGNAGDSFFIGAFTTVEQEQYPAAIDTSSMYQAESWIASDYAGQGDIEDLSNNLLPPQRIHEACACQGNWLLRAVSSAGVECLCPADLNGDGSVGILDLLALLAAWGTDPGGPPDFDGDGTVGILDLLTLLANWGPCA